MTNSSISYKLYLPNTQIIRQCPDLAIELNDDRSSMILLQLDWWFERYSKKMSDGKFWFKMSAKEMCQKAFPFLSESTVKNRLGKLQAAGYIDSTESFNRSSYDRTRWWRIVPEGMMTLTSIKYLPHRPPNSVDQSPNSVDQSPNPVDQSPNPVDQSPNPVDQRAPESVDVLYKDIYNKEVSRKYVLSEDDFLEEVGGRNGRVSFYGFDWSECKPFYLSPPLRIIILGIMKLIRKLTVTDDIVLQAFNLADKGFLGEQCFAVAHYWQTVDWRGLKGEVPRLNEVVEIWDTAVLTFPDYEPFDFSYSDYDSLWEYLEAMTGVL